MAGRRCPDAGRRERTDALTRVTRAATLIALFGSLSSAAVLTIANLGSTKLNNGGQEQNIIFAIQAMLDGQDLYRDPGRMPFTAIQYTPIFYDLCFALCRGLGLGSGDLHEIYLVGRLVSTTASLGCCLLIFTTLARYTLLDAGMRLALAFLPPLLAATNWAFVARPDALYLFFVTASLVAGMRYAEAPGLTRLAICAALLLAGFYTKQTALFLFPLPFAVSFACRGWRALKPRDVAVCLAIYGFGALFITRSMAGNFAVGLGNGIDLAGAFRNVYLPELYRAPLLVVAAVTLKQTWRDPDWRPRAIGLATLWFLAVGAVLGLKYGAAYNYMSESLVGCLLLAGMAPGLARGSGSEGQRTIAPVLIGLVVVEQLAFVWLDLPGVRSMLAPQQEIYRWGRALATDPELRGSNILVLNFWAFVFIPDRAAFAPIDVMGSSAATGHYDLSPIIRAVRDGKLCFAVTDREMLPSLLGAPGARDSPDWMPAIGPVLLTNFHPVRDIGPMVLSISEFCGQNGPSGQSPR